MVAVAMPIMHICTTSGTGCAAGCLLAVGDRAIGQSMASHRQTIGPCGANSPYGGLCSAYVTKYSEYLVLPTYVLPFSKVWS